MRALRIALLGASLMAAAPVLAQQAPPAAPGATDESRAAARDLLVALDSARQAEQVMSIVSQQIVDEVLMPEFRARLPEMTDFTAELWASQMTAAELRELKAFYETPLGRRLQAVTPAVAAGAAAFGMKWGQDVGMSALAKHRDTLRARGLKI